MRKPAALVCAEQSQVTEYSAAASLYDWLAAVKLPTALAAKHGRCFARIMASDAGRAHRSHRDPASLRCQTPAWPPARALTGEPFRSAPRHHDERRNTANSSSARKSNSLNATWTASVRSLNKTAAAKSSSGSNPPSSARCLYNQQLTRYRLDVNASFPAISPYPRWQWNWITFSASADMLGFVGIVGQIGSSVSPRTINSTFAWRNCLSRYADFVGKLNFCSRQFIGIALSKSSSDNGSATGWFIRLSIDRGLSWTSFMCARRKRGDRPCLPASCEILLALPEVSCSYQSRARAMALRIA